ncbi:MAG TPA: glucose 1-dehydrogenase [Trebonia sp.]|jgi:NAD(P)-dependent dehydrogenase (short-subunit alcohol dehydrogenase family)
MDHRDRGHAHLVMTGLNGRVAIVTGASRGIGRAVATRLAAAGATVVVGFRGDPVAARQVAASVVARGGAAEAVRLEVTDAGQAARVVADVVQRHGRLDVLVNNAGILPRKGFLDIELEEWEAVLRTNLTGAFILSQLAARVMAGRGSGSIVNVSSTNEQTASSGCTAYAASKGGIRMLTRQMALELGPLGIRANAVAPGMVETDLNVRQRAAGSFRKDALDHIPIGRFATVTDVAEAVCFLAGDSAAAVNGVTLFVDGGRLAA